MIVWAAVVLLVICGLYLLAVQDHRLALLAVGVQYAGAALLVGTMWPFAMAVSRVVSGWMAVAILLVSIRQSSAGDDPLAANPGGQIFRLLTAVLVLLATVSLLEPVARVIPGIPLLPLLGAMWLVGNGLLQMGFSLHPLRTVLAWLTTLTGFELAYAAVERSILMAALLAVLHLALALAGAYLLALPEAQS
ncbi:MAG: hypothetical protein D6755_03810 [Anaerolineae bacterium]|nr:MAG: hypothetical protein D6755_03810 [Anaerolineae bacterium]